MDKYLCPLCGQDVTKSMYEKITGIWKEKEKQMSELKQKEKALREKEKKLLEKFELEKQKAVKKEKEKLEKKLKEQRALLSKERESIKQEKKKLKTEYDKRIFCEVNRMQKEEGKKQKDLEKRLRLEFDKDLVKKLQKEKAGTERENKKQKHKHEQLAKQFSLLQKSSMIQLSKANKKIQSLEEQIKKNETPQVLGFTNETEFLIELKKKFPEDKFEHTGKRGDILHFVMSKNKQIGVICYELKKVSVFSSSHIKQAYKAKQDRNADYGILVTNAAKSNQQMIFDMQKGIIIIHPAGAMILILLLRNHLLDISRLKLSSTKREQKIDAVLTYIQSPSFKNSIESIILDTIDLHESLQKEVKSHVSVWKGRLNSYRNIHGQAVTVDSKILNITIEDKKESKQADYKAIDPIDLPQRID